MRVHREGVIELTELECEISEYEDQEAQRTSEKNGEALNRQRARKQVSPMTRSAQPTNHVGGSGQSVPAWL